MLDRFYRMRFPRFNFDCDKFISLFDYLVDISIGGNLFFKLDFVTVRFIYFCDFIIPISVLNL